MCIGSRRRSPGFTLVELLVLVLVLGISAGGVFAAVSYVTVQTPDAMVRKQAMALAESTMDEILMRTFSTYAANPITLANRQAANHDADDYNGFSMTGYRTFDDVMIPPGLEGYNTVVAVTPVAFGPGAAQAPGTDSYYITVTVTGPRGIAVTLESFRLKTD